MPTEVPRCMDCGTALKAVPAWLAPAKVSFTCVSCPRRSTRTATAAAAARLEKPVEVKSALPDDLDADDTDEIDDDVDLELPEEDLDDVKDDVEL